MAREAGMENAGGGEVAHAFLADARGTGGVWSIVLPFTSLFPAARNVVT